MPGVGFIFILTQFSSVNLPLRSHRGLLQPDEFCQSLEPASWPSVEETPLPRFSIFLPSLGSAPKASPKEGQACAQQGTTRTVRHTRRVVEGPPGRGPQTMGPPGRGPPGRGPPGTVRISPGFSLSEPGCVQAWWTVGSRLGCQLGQVSPCTHTYTHTHTHARTLSLSLSLSSSAETLRPAEQLIMRDRGHLPENAVL